MDDIQVMETEPSLPNEIPLTVMISTERKTKGVVSVFDNVAAIKAIKVSKERLNTIPDEWKIGCGFYFLVSDIADGHFHAYVGKATQNNFYSRLSSHRREKDNWDYAFLFQRDTSNGLNSTQASYVEGEIYKLIAKTEEIDMLNSQTAGDKTLADHELFYMNQIVKSSLRILDIFGYHVGTKEEPKKRSSYYGVSIKQLVNTGLLIPGEKIVPALEKYPADNAILGETGIIVNTDEQSPSASANHAYQTLTGKETSSVNGWDFWGVKRETVTIPLHSLREDYLRDKKLYEESNLTERDIDFTEAVHSNEQNKSEVRKDPERHADSRVKVYELVDAGFLEDGMEVFSVDPEYPFDAVIEHNSIRFNNNSYPSPSIAAKYARRSINPDAPLVNGWEFWGVENSEGRVLKFSDILDDFLLE